MVEYFAGSDQDASRILMHAAELAPEPETALEYLGKIQLDQASAPATAAFIGVDTATQGNWPAEYGADGYAVDSAPTSLPSYATVMLAGGLTDLQIAEQLVLSPRTVHAHISSIYSKLAVTSRSAATRYAIEHHLA